MASAAMPVSRQSGGTRSTLIMVEISSMMNVLFVQLVMRVWLVQSFLSEMEIAFVQAVSDLFYSLLFAPKSFLTVANFRPFNPPLTPY